MASSCRSPIQSGHDKLIEQQAWLKRLEAEIIKEEVVQSASKSPKKTDETDLVTGLHQVLLRRSVYHIQEQR